MVLMKQGAVRFRHRSLWPWVMPFTSGFLCVALSILAGYPGAAADGPTGHYRMSGGPDIASELVLRADGSFSYFLAAGSLDEHAEGSWTIEGSSLRLHTNPEPVPAVFSAGNIEYADDKRLEVHVTDPEGHGFSGIDLTLGFARGAPIDAYTQDYGWTLDDGLREPRWIQFSIPGYQLRSQRFPVALADGNALTFILTVNDLGTINFDGVQVDIRAGALVMHRGEEIMVFKAMGSS